VIAMMLSCVCVCLQSQTSDRVCAAAAEWNIDYAPEKAVVSGQEEFCQGLICKSERCSYM